MNTLLKIVAVCLAVAFSVGFTQLIVTPPDCGCKDCPKKCGKTCRCVSPH